MWWVFRLKPDSWLALPSGYIVLFIWSLSFWNNVVAFFFCWPFIFDFPVINVCPILLHPWCLCWNSLPHFFWKHFHFQPFSYYIHKSWPLPSRYGSWFGVIIQAKIGYNFARWCLERWHMFWWGCVCEGMCVLLFKCLSEGNYLCYWLLILMHGCPRKCTVRHWLIYLLFSLWANT